MLNRDSPITSRRGSFATTLQLSSTLIIEAAESVGSESRFSDLIYDCRCVCFSCSASDAENESVLLLLSYELKRIFGLFKGLKKCGAGACACARRLPDARFYRISS